MTYQTHDGHVGRSNDLHRHILRSHLAYLGQEETPAKLEQRRNLESLISDFLAAVSHRAKFSFVEMEKILNTSIEGNLGFSACKAGSAFEALEKYATNLINHPWRKEYKTVKLYSGFYKHSVENQLLGGSSVFHLLGYQFTGEGILFLNEPVDPDKAARVALDCLIAYVECQIMLQICEKVKSFKCSWLEIHNVRQDYICGVEESVRILHQLKRNVAEQEKQDRWLREQENDSFTDDKLLIKPSSSYEKTGILVDVSNTWPSSSSYPGYTNGSLVLQPTVVAGPHTTKSSKSSMLGHTKLPSWSEGVTSHIGDYSGRGFVSKADDGFAGHSFDDCIQPNYKILGKSGNHSSRYDHDMASDGWNDSWDVLQPSLQPSYHTRNDGYCESDGQRTAYNVHVPNFNDAYTSQLGHMYSSHPLPVGLPVYPLPHEFAVHPRQCPCQMCCGHQMPVHKYPTLKDGNFESHKRSTRPESNHIDDPSEVCSSLLKLSVDGTSSKSRNFPIASALSSYQSGSSPVTSAFSSYQSGNDVVLRQNGVTKPQQKRGSYYDNVPSPFDEEVSNAFSAGRQSLSSKCDLKTNGTLISPTTTPSKSRIQKVADASKPLLKKSYSNPPLEQKTSNAKSKDAKNSKKWSCTSCTYYNAPEKSICDMCGRSKNPGPEIAPLVSGGRECPQCTLVNKKDTENCTACGTSLKDSPTYI